MKTARTVALSLLLFGLVGCATDQNRYYVPGDSRSGDYYYAPAPRDEGYDPYFYGDFGWGGYCPWGLFDCWSAYDNGVDFSFGVSYGPWWGNSPYLHVPPPSHRDPHRPDDRAWSSTDSQDVPAPRRERSREVGDPGRSALPPPRAQPAFPDPPRQERGRERRGGSPPAGV
jgi:hypothetical protein